ncbi:MAG: LacI family DNA-binding transcriptional regulator [Anaerolineae bacterium]
MVTVRDVAKRAGVAPITVSRVVNNAPGVNPTTRERVEQAIADLHYVPNAMAQSLRSNRTHTIAVILTDVTNPFWTTLVRGVEDTAARQNYHVILCNTDEDAEKEANYISILLQRRVDGIIIAPCTQDKKRLQVLKRHNVPCVLVDRQVRGFRSDIVRSDGQEGARRLTEHLIGLGHHAIAMVIGPAGISTAAERLEGYCQALEAHGIPIDESLIKRGSYTQDRSTEFVKELLSQPRRPTAILAANNFLGMSVLQALRDANLQVPQDIALVCFDDIPQASLIYPFLTVCAQDAYKMGVDAAELLLKRMSTKSARPKIREIVLDTELIVRKSCGQELGRRAF